jgi:RNA polymerase sigma factor (sigma-70 family)
MMAGDTHDQGKPGFELEELFHRLAPALIAWASLRIPQQIRTLVSPEDLAQEVWLRAARIYSTSFDPVSSSPRAWLFAVAKNVLLEAKRSALRLRERSADGSTSRLLALEEVPASISSFTKRLAREDSIQKFLARVAEMSEDERSLLLYCAMEGLSLREAAERLGIDLEAATKRWQRLRARIAEWPSSREFLALGGL